MGALFLILPMGMLYPLWGCPTSAGEDDVVYYWPLRTMTAQRVRAGQWPGWNRAEAGGVPLFADPQTGLFYPANWLFLVLPGKLAYSLCIFLAFSLAGGGAYLYLRRVGAAAPAATFGAVAFMFCGFMVGHRVHLSLIQAAGLLGWGLWSIEKVRSDARAAFAWMTPIFALTLAAGHWPSAVHMVVIWLAYLLLRGRPVRRALTVAVAAAVLGAVCLGPQILATAAHLTQSIRSDVPYAVAGENSFFPLCGVLAFFPFIMGCRTPNLFPQDWWGPWHLCEMLGYVGLVTLPLAGAAVWRMFGRRRPPPRTDGAGGEAPTSDPAGVVRAWTWILIGAGVWALGYYLPTYRLIHKVPVLGVVRCPARMLLAIDFALAVLAALAVNALATAPSPRLARTVRRMAALWLPLAMAGGLALLLLAAAGEAWGWWRLRAVLSGPTDAIRDALNPRSPALYIPVVLAGVTLAALWWFGRAPARRTWWLIGLLLVDLLFITRFVDVPARGCPDPSDSPAARWLRANAATTRPFRVLGLGGSYHERPGELLLPKTCGSLGFETISYYGPFQPADHALLFGFRSWGWNEHWEWLIRRNHLLSLYNVRYVLAADPEFRRVVESVRVPQVPPPPEGANLLGDGWSFRAAGRAGEGLVFRSARLWSPALARQGVALAPSRVYRIALDVRAPKGAGNLILARWAPGPDPPAGWDTADSTLRIDAEQVTRRWRHFERTFEGPGGTGAPPCGSGTFEIRSHGDRPVEVRNVALRRSHRETPICFDARLAPGQAVYADRTPGGLPPLRAGDPPVHVYENRLCLPRRFRVDEAVPLGDNERVTEELRWSAGRYDLTRQALVPSAAGSRGDLEFVSERLCARRGGGCVPANGLGALLPAGGTPAGPRGQAPGEQAPGWAPLAGAAAAICAYLVFGIISAHRMNKSPRGPVRKAKEGSDPLGGG